MRRHVAALAAVFVILGALASGPSFAAPPTAESIDRLLEITRVKPGAEGIDPNVVRSVQQMMAAAGSGSDTSDENRRVREAIAAHMPQVLERYRDAVPWAQLEPIYVRAYQDVYTQEDIDGLIVFFGSPAGQAYLTKNSLAQQKAILQVLPLMAPAMKEMQAELRQVIEDARKTPAQ